MYERENIRKIETIQNIFNFDPIYFEYKDKNITDKTQCGFPDNVPEILPHLFVAVKQLDKIKNQLTNNSIIIGDFNTTPFSIIADL